MNTFPQKLSGCLAVLMAWAVAAEAQSTIQFSVPEGTDKVDKSSGLDAPVRSKKLSVKDYNAPVSLFGQYDPAHSFDRLPLGPSYGEDTSANARKWKQFLDGKKNWALMTPEKIMGVQTPEEILGIGKSKEQAELSAEDRYLLRQSGLASHSATNGAAGFSSLKQPDFAAGIFGRREDQPDSSKNDGLETRNVNQALRMTAKSSPFAVEQNGGYVGGNPFGLPAPSAKASTEQLASMERFRAMLDDSAPVEKPAVATVFSPPTTTPRSVFGLGAGNANPLLQSASLENPAGHSYQPLTRELVKPVGIAPLSGISRPVVSPATKSATAPKLPPWMTDPTQPFKRY